MDKKLLSRNSEKEIIKRQKAKIMKFFGAMKDLDIDWEKKEKVMKEFRRSVNKRMNDTARKMNQELK